MLQLFDFDLHMIDPMISQAPADMQTKFLSNYFNINERDIDSQLNNLFHKEYMKPKHHLDNEMGGRIGNFAL